MRGLKRNTRNNPFVLNVASFTDAWIETPRFVCLPLTIESHLLQMRGLKQKGDTSDDFDCASHLLQMRGLKQDNAGKH